MNIFCLLPMYHRTKKDVDFFQECALLLPPPTSQVSMTCPWMRERAIKSLLAEVGRPPSSMRSPTCSGRHVRKWSLERPRSFFTWETENHTIGKSATKFQMT